MMQKQKLNSILPSGLRRLLIYLYGFLLDGYATKSYSQEGEDMVLNRIFNGKERGFYVDVGAHHPRRFSNTFFFYRRGWKGINIEPNPDIVNAFRLDRKRDINLQLGISDSIGTITYYMFDEPALNTFDESIVKSRLDNTSYKLVETREVPVGRLDQVLEKYLEPNCDIDFLTIDVEGMDLSVLKSNDWQRFRPRCVLVEALGVSLEEIIHDKIYLYMNSCDYELFSKTYNTVIFRDKKTS